MLYDPKRWPFPQTPVKKPRTWAMSMKGLVAWLETQPPEKEYNYAEVRHCLLSQYLRARGWRGAMVSPSSILGLRFWVVPWVQSIPYGMNNVAMYSPHTFGAALERARAALAK